jgi:integrase
VLFKAKYSYYSLEGKRVPAGTPGAKRVARQSKTYYADLPNPGGRPTRIALGPNKQAALRKLHEILEAGRRPGHDRHADDATLEAIEAYVRHLSTGAGGKRGAAPGSRYLNQVRSVLRSLLVQQCGFATLGQLRSEPVREALAGQASAANGPPPLPALEPGETGYCSAVLARWLEIRPASFLALRRRLGIPGEGSGHRRRFRPEEALRLAAHSRKYRPARLTSESRWHYTRMARAFSTWLHNTGRIARNLFADLPLPRRDQVERHQRRALRPEEIDRLLRAAATSPRTVFDLSGRQRHMLYLLALSTGFRAGELISLTPAHFRLTDPTPHILLPGSVDKRGDAARQPLPQEILAEVEAYLAGLSPDRLLFGGKLNSIRTARLLRIDLAAAGIPYVLRLPEGDCYADFHALRHTFIARLDRAGLTLKQAMQLARHSTPVLTARVYGRASLAELGASVNRLRLGDSPGQA